MSTPPPGEKAVSERFPKDAFKPVRFGVCSETCRGSLWQAAADVFRSLNSAVRSVRRAGRRCGGWRRVRAGRRGRRGAVAGRCRGGAPGVGRPAPARRGRPGSALGYCHDGLTCQRDVQSRVFHSGQLPRFRDKQQNSVCPCSSAEAAAPG